MAEANTLSATGDEYLYSLGAGLHLRLAPVRNAAHALSHIGAQGARIGLCRRQPLEHTALVQPVHQ